MMKIARWFGFERVRPRLEGIENLVADPESPNFRMLADVVVAVGGSVYVGKATRMRDRSGTAISIREDAEGGLWVVVRGLRRQNKALHDEEF